LSRGVLILAKLTRLHIGAEHHITLRQRLTPIALDASKAHQKASYKKTASGGSS